MRKIILVISLALLMSTLQSQSYLINFAGTGASTSVDSVHIQNLTQCTILKIGGGDILHLVWNAGINEKYARKNKSLYIFPNPFAEFSSIEFESPVSENAVIKIYDITGKIIIQTQNTIKQGKNNYSISGIKEGVYVIQIIAEAYTYAGKFLSTYKGAGTPNITCQNETQIIAENPKTRETKSTNSIIQMQYNDGDRLKITGISSIYRTIFILVPTSNQTVTFDFIACTDGDGNNYAVVQIGSQVWMAENLKTTKYRSGTSIPHVTDNGTWSSLTSGAYCNYNNDANIVNTYGRLYNWYTTTNPQNLAPNGWHVPSWAELVTLSTYLGGGSVAGGKLKENCSALWNSPNTGATNETGFTALPGGKREFDGTFSEIQNYGHFWSSTQSGPSAYWAYLYFADSNFDGGTWLLNVGFSIRCVRD